jgi:TetR/AcrR family transcriptional repressor of bet genes
MSAGARQLAYTAPPLDCVAFAQIGVAPASSGETTVHPGTNMKTRIEDIRRNDLIRAAYQVFLEHGVGGMTVARIGERVGMSHGIVNYYFKTKDDLLQAVMRHAFRQISEEAVSRLNRAQTPRERVDAIVRANFLEGVFERETAAAWLSFYGLAPQRPEFARLQMAYYKRLHSDLVHALKQMLPDDQAEKVATGISVLIDGMWVRRAMISSESSIDEMIAFIDEYIDDHTRGVTPDARPAKPRRRAAGTQSVNDGAVRRRR